MVTTWMGHRYVPDFAPAPRFFRSQILCRLFKKGETINGGPQCVYACKKIANACYKDHLVLCQSSVDYGNTHARTHARTHTHTPTHARTHAHSHTHTHTHTHTPTHKERACNKNVRIFTVLKLDTIRKKKKKSHLNEIITSLFPHLHNPFPPSPRP